MLRGKKVIGILLARGRHRRPRRPRQVYLAWPSLLTKLQQPKASRAKPQNITVPGQPSMSPSLTRPWNVIKRKVFLHRELNPGLLGESQVS